LAFFSVLLLVLFVALVPCEELLLLLALVPVAFCSVVLLLLLAFDEM
jgi:hypothetical protein